MLTNVGQDESESIDSGSPDAFSRDAAQDLREGIPVDDAAANGDETSADMEDEISVTEYMNRLLGRNRATSDAPEQQDSKAPDSETTTDCQVDAADESEADVVESNGEPECDADDNAECLPAKSPQRVQRRFEVRKGQVLTATLEIGDDESHAVEIADISPSGAKLWIGSPLKPADEVVFRITNGDPTVDLVLAATVRWCNIRQQQWVVGILFAEVTIASDVLHDLATFGIIERRQRGRKKIRLSGLLKRAGSPDAVPVDMTDLSETGISIVSNEPIEVDERLLLTLEWPDHPPASIVAIARWVEPAASAFIIGCEVQNNLSPDVLERCGIRPPAKALRRTISRLTWAVVTLCALISTALFCMKQEPPEQVLIEIQRVEAGGSLFDAPPW